MRGRPPLRRQVGPSGTRRLLFVVAPRIFLPLLILGALVGIWWFMASTYPPYDIPEPRSVWQEFFTLWRRGVLLPAFGTTCEEAGVGWVLGSLCALPVGYLLGRLRSLEQALAPYVAASQAMPVLALAPLLGIWFGFGLRPKVVIAALIVFFPVMATTVAGIRAIDRDLRDVARIFGAGPLQTAIYLEAPAAARSILTGEKVGAALAVTGALVGEYVSSDQGLGNLVLQGVQNFDSRLVFVALISLMFTGAAAYAAINLLERIVLCWTE